MITIITLRGPHDSSLKSPQENMREMETKTRLMRVSKRTPWPLVCPAFRDWPETWSSDSAQPLRDPTGGYSTHCFTSEVPEDAIEMHKAARSKKLCAMHQSPFVVSKDESVNKLPVRLTKSIKEPELLKQGTTDPTSNLLPLSKLPPLSRNDLRNSTGGELQLQAPFCKLSSLLTFTSC
ncbi:hypothetical protein DFS34DRAFT_173797 [Phlyctochytrium arcticum]|nr:hypothetical protein DFS34DRAFT_173797 [Phlyctochytrium arcticum]